jgi:L-ribulose-5-phosphate 3-epimerase
MSGHTLPPIGLYEKALPARFDWPQRLAVARSSGFDFVEMSIDESDARLARLDWSRQQRRDFRYVVEDSGIAVPSVCLSAHRRFPFGSADPALRARARDVMSQAIQLACDVGVRTLQLAGYDVYYEPSTPDSLKRFEEGLAWANELAARNQVMLAMEIMDTPLMGSISKWLRLADSIRGPWFQVYPDLGNLSAWGNDVSAELAKGLAHIVAVHLKDTLAVSSGFPGKFRDVPFGAGCVDFVAAFAALKRLGYRGCYLIEMWSGEAEDPVGAVGNARTWVIERMIEGERLA